MRATGRPSRSRARGGCDLDRHRTHGHRPGRDDPLPARHLAGPPGAARHAAAQRAPGPAAAGRLDASRPAPTAGRPGLPWREDETNADRLFARNRLRLEVLPRAAGDPSRRGARTSSRPRTQLREEEEVLERAVDEAADAGRRRRLPPAVEAARLRELARALRRLLLRRLAEQAAGGAAAAVARAQCGRSSAWPRAAAAVARPRRRVVRRSAEYGVIRFRRGAEQRASPSPAALAVPGRCRFGEWELSPARTRGRRRGLGSLDEPAARPRPLATPLTVRGWRDGDRMRPLGLGGTKSLQDLFTDRKVPRSLRRTPAGGRVRAARSPGWREWRSRSGSRSPTQTHRCARLRCQDARYAVAAS